MAENEQAQAPQQQFAVQRIYIKDSSFESPMGAAVFGKQWQPNINVEMNNAVNKVGEDTYEAVLTFTVTAKLGEETAALIEVQQAGLFLAKGIEGEQLRQALSILAPNLLFPYVREAIDSMSVKGGFPAIALQPVNFEAIYRQQVAQQAAQQATPADAEAH
ncbi:protein-export chaperone SecB [Oceanicoccus sp. KOV_DT_Chl]|uniref:protein-export chaperone SecB n=1 Tax=Oceanicoccus sp. KOV_DT_Chl TaxID=1904639 RepID=UPI000C7E3AD8|nr:protein-export chaperone SecB [Oceanicoccus sp. KOV_DT_Chl]